MLLTLGHRFLSHRAHVRQLVLSGRRCLSLVRDRALVAGEWCSAADGATFDVTDPATGAVLASVPDMAAADAERAVAAAAEAQQEWRETSPKYRSQLLQAYCRLLEEHADQLAALITAEQGKPLAEARAEVAYGTGYVEWFAAEARRIYGDYIPSAVPEKETLMIRQPAGVAALITPWNFPLAMLARKLGAALACGCAAVAKPAEDTPLTALAMAALAERAGLPAGVFSVVTASRQRAPEVGSVLCEDDRVAVVSFTGSTAVGKLLYKQCASTVKKVCLELGGNSPFIVFDSADVEKAVAGCMASKFRNAGQTCVSTNRILVQSGVHDRFVEALSAAMAGQLRLGNGGDDGVNVGPLVNDAQLKKVSGLVSESVRQGATVRLGGRPEGPGPRFFPPTLLTKMTPEMAAFREEVFGPVAACAKFETEEEAIRIANNTDMGLAAYFYTENIAQAWRVSKRLQYGMVGVNEGLISAVEVGFGGVKQSGVGREGGHFSVEDYTELKYICFGTK